MTNYIKNGLKLGLGYGLAKLAGASNKDDDLLSDKNVNNAIFGAVSGIFLIPRAKESMETILKDVSDGKMPNAKRILTYTAVGAASAGIFYAIENGAGKKIATTISDTYKKLKSEGS